MNPKIINFTPMKDAKNFLGFCSLEIHAHLNGQLIPLIVKAKVMRNSNNGHVFIAMHQESYKKPDGTTGYSNIVRVPDDKYADFNKATSKAWDEYMASKNPQLNQVSQSGQVSESFYPRGMAKNMQSNTGSFSPTSPSPSIEQKKYQDEELPF